MFILDPLQIALAIYCNEAYVEAVFSLKKYVFA